jgi:HAD superfamily hydrolase (TIGR01509 family)
MSGIVLVLDAMGAIFQAGDDVAELLVPFVAHHGGLKDERAVGDLYDRASRGEMTAAQLWEGLRVPAALEDEYLLQHRLSDGFSEFLNDLPEPVDALWCLSNDVTEWSVKLRDIYGIRQYFAGFVISGDVKVRKPDPKIYEILLERIGRPASECVFVDDRPKNLLTAKRLGFHTVLFGEFAPAETDHYHGSVKSFAELAGYLKKRP